MIDVRTHTHPMRARVRWRKYIRRLRAERSSHAYCVHSSRQSCLEKIVRKYGSVLIDSSHYIIANCDQRRGGWGEGGLPGRGIECQNAQRGVAIEMQFRPPPQPPARAHAR